MSRLCFWESNLAMENKSTLFSPCAMCVYKNMLMWLNVTRGSPSHVWRSRRPRPTAPPSDRSKPPPALLGVAWWVLGGSRGLPKYVGDDHNTTLEILIILYFQYWKLQYNIGNLDHINKIFLVIFIDFSYHQINWKILEIFDDEWLTQKNGMAHAWKYLNMPVGNPWT